MNFSKTDSHEADIHRWFMSQVKRYGGCYVEIESPGTVRYSWGKRDDSIERELEDAKCHIASLEEELKQHKGKS